MRERKREKKKIVYDEYKVFCKWVAFSSPTSFKTMVTTLMPMPQFSISLLTKSVGKFSLPYPLAQILTVLLAFIDASLQQPVGHRNVLVAAGVLQNDNLAVRTALGNGHRTLGTSLKGGLGAHLRTGQLVILGLGHKLLGQTVHGTRVNGLGCWLPSGTRLLALQQAPVRVYLELESGLVVHELVVVAHELLESGLELADLSVLGVQGEAVVAAGGVQLALACFSSLNSRAFSSRVARSDEVLSTWLTLDISSACLLACWVISSVFTLYHSSSSRFCWSFRSSKSPRMSRMARSSSCL
ncbi:hypothetical protein BpHYR1_028184 [Brachionus plicatilis]|uniref:Uncharacterized protein n=1 Tax=Brachionus plicatilis TaxID=10195 RepID=A0A3M7QYD3_BRAPC|nr:hypothetical protein BpHYR1_028184 [Brachionus plicatilis]